MDQRIVLGLAVGGGFLFVCACAACVRALSELSGMRERKYSTVPQDGKANGQEEEQERDQILSEVYGRPAGDDDFDEEQHDSPVKDDVALDKAWEAIKREESSDDDDEALAHVASHEASPHNQERDR
eukprot:CAMPEP_0168466832 /NCGR_PEP_ID=MMETSP0228-20121227/56864_1 /TAXON_ID=133427 /ORGANISM="Protoceratium reticulatum, Strain CCCM 535 (=CCMP 1889)" /LENGTH=126 /DNA_ID=CAMNT_0008482511 /DNA_START=22 /DNA_END=398 /DNA_ORIENTATION=+